MEVKRRENHSRSERDSKGGAEEMEESEEKRGKKGGEVREE